MRKSSDPRRTNVNRFLNAVPNINMCSTQHLFFIFIFQGFCPSLSLKCEHSPCTPLLPSLQRLAFPNKPTHELSVVPTTEFSHRKNYSFVVCAPCLSPTTACSAPPRRPPRLATAPIALAAAALWNKTASLSAPASAPAAHALHSDSAALQNIAAFAFPRVDSSCLNLSLSFPPSSFVAAPFLPGRSPSARHHVHRRRH